RTTPPNTISFVPTQAVLNGDFSALESAACQSSGKARTITNPSTGVPFPNAQVPVSSFNPAALNLLKGVPVSSNPCGRTVYGIPNPSAENQEIGRFDWNISSSHSIFGRYFITKYNAPAPTLNGDQLLSTLPAAIDRSESAVVGDNYSFSANAINSAHATWSRTQIGRGPSSGLTDPNSLGINMYQVVPGFMNLSASGYFAVGCGSCAPAAFNRASVQLADDFDLIRGRHHIAFGGEWIHTLLNSFNVFNGNGSFTFNGQFSGDSLVDLMLGQPSSLTQGNIGRGNYRQDYIGTYAQDSFHVNAHFNVNFGVRWEPYLPAADVYNRGGYFSPAAFAAGQTSSQYANSPAGLFFVGDPGIPRGYTNKRYSTLAPRLGIVWDPKGDGRQTIRAGYGMFYDFAGLQFTTGFNSDAPWGSTVTLTSLPGGLSNPYAGIAGGNPFPVPSPPTRNQPFPLSGTYITLPLNMKPTTMQQWNLSYSRQIGEWVVSATYMANSSRHIYAGLALNPSVYIPGTCNGAACSTTKNTQQRRVLYLENPAQGQYYGSMVQAFPDGDASYQAVIFTAKRHFSHNYTVMANYTYSHCISDADYAGDIGGSSTTGVFENPNSLRQDFGNCNFDLRQNFNASVVAAAPSFRTHWEEAVLGGWQLSPIVSYHSGFWFSPLSGLDNSLTGVGLDRPNVLGNPYIRNLNTLQWISAAAFSQNAAGTFGNAGRDSLEGPGAFDIDAALSRTFQIHESHRLELRFEFFNVLNGVRFSNPPATLSLSTFGKIQAAGDPRILQFALKYSF
ncbi:MAG: carboxypeptidase regulatory-like domain-containing protein, partial [Bryobacteraceae bacterium]